MSTYRKFGGKEGVVKDTKAIPPSLKFLEVYNPSGNGSNIPPTVPEAYQTHCFYT
jgi:hypothetical protein